MTDDPALRVKVSEAGAELQVGTELPTLLDRILPIGRLAKRSGEQALTQRVAEKLLHGRQLSDAELGYAVHAMGENVSRFARLEAITRRAGELVARPPLRLPSATSDRESQPQARTSNDWVNKYREDASLVDDEMIREAYSRILAAESASPGSCSLRTLGVLRHLDHEVADAFARVCSAIVNRAAVPVHDAIHTASPVPKLGIAYSTMLDIADAGLINPTRSRFVIDGSEPVVVASAHRCAIRWNRDGKVRSIVHPLEVHALTRAGRELAGLIDIPEIPGARDAVIEWVAHTAGSVEVSTAPVPLNWDGDSSTLCWTPWKRPQ